MVLERKYWLSVLGITVILILGAIAISITQSAWEAKPVYGAEDSQAKSEQRTITVTGNGEIEVEPDVAYLHFSVMTKAATAEAAQQENATIFAKVEKVLFDTYKLNKKDVKTTGFHVYPEYRYHEKDEPKITGYTATHRVSVTYRELDKIGALLDAVSKAGVNQMENIQFASEKISEHESEALKKAMADARAKAEVLAAAEKQTIKGVLHINEAGGNHTVYPVASMGMAREMAMMDMSSTTSISPGEITIRKQVTVQYQF